MRRALIGLSIVAVAVPVVGLMGAEMLVASAAMGSAEAAMVPICADLGYQVDPLGLPPAVPTGGRVSGFGPDEDEQVSVAQAIVAAGRAAGVPERGLVVAVATALQESGLRNLDHGDRDSLGVFQQRPSQGWGTPTDLQDVTIAARAFFGGSESPHHDPATGRTEPRGLLDVDGWEQMSITAAAQSVQRSGFPDAYADHEDRAQVIVSGILGTPGSVDPTGLGSYRAEGTDATTLAADGVDVEAFCSSAFERRASIAMSTITSMGSLGAWGGHQNGRIPHDELTALTWAPSHRLRPDAAAALEALNVEYRAVFGRNLTITDSYRTYAQQVALKAAKPRLAATPGTSQHGWAVAVDLGGGVQSFGTPQHAWMVTNGPHHGWHPPAWAQASGSKPEPWHFEFGN
ncbi:MAG: M15 family metallopeptidase [Micrococcales bacterium]|nr:M15 family metallopeptidase [Micrococcales bacterium]